MYFENFFALVWFFYSAYYFFRRHQSAFFSGLLLVFGLLAYLASSIRFEEDITRLIPTDEDSERISEVLQATQFADKLVINVKSTDPGDIGTLQRYADDFESAMRDHAAPFIDKLQVQVSDDQLGDLLDVVTAHLPLFLEEADYRQLDSLLQPQMIEATVQESYRSVISPSGFVDTRFVREDPFGIAFMGLRKFQRLQSGEAFRLHDGYLISEQGDNLLMFITPSFGSSETANNAEFIKLLDEQLQTLNQAYADRANAEYFGAAAVAVANAKQIKTDIQVTLTIALIILVLLFVYFYRRIYIPLIILFPAAFGSLLGITVLYFLKGTISAISIGIGSVLLGLTLDYSLHILSHYRSTGDIRKLFHSVTKPLIICAVFTAADFLCLLFLRSDVLHDLGIFAAVSVLGAGFFALIFIPQAYSPGSTVQLKQNTFIDGISRYDFSRNSWLLAACLAATVISFFTYQRVGFNNDLAALNYQPTHLQQAEQRLDSLNNYGAKSIYLVAYDDTYEDALKRNSDLFRQLEEMEKPDSILSFSSIGGIMLSKADQLQKINRWKAFWSPEKKETVRQSLIHEGRKVGFKDNTFLPFFEVLSKDFIPMEVHGQPLLNDLFLDDYVSSDTGLTTITSIIKTNAKNTDSLIRILSANTENILVIDRKHLQENFLLNLEEDFNKLFLISSVAVFVILFLFFGSLELTLITNIPIFLGWFITLGMMGALGLSFNAFNIIITTLIFGLGVDYSIFVTKGLLEMYTYGRKEMPAYKSGIIMSALATILCFGVLAFARHPAIKSISIIPLIGLLIVVLMSFTVQPWLFRLFILKPQQKGNVPRRITHVLLTVFTFGYFFVGGFILNLLAQFLIPIVPVSKKKKYTYFHRVVHAFFQGLVYGTPFSKISITGRSDSYFDKPGIIISNHTSRLDTPILGMLHPKLIFMVNQRVLNSVFFGKAIRMAGYYAVTNGYEESLDSIRKKLRQGYSVIIFPEGTRSVNAAINRFHKGAFYLSEKLEADILPILIHGNADYLPKSDDIVKAGNINIKFLPRIAHHDPVWGSNYSERTKNISKYIKQEFNALRREKEDADYFRKKLYRNYLFKPRSIQQAIKTEFQTHKHSYHQLFKILPLKAEILHIGCDFSVLDFLLVYDSPLRRITAWDKDPDKIAVNQNTYSVKRYSLSFIHQLPDKTNHFDVLILSDPDTAYPTALLNSTEWVVFKLHNMQNFPILDESKYELIFRDNRLMVYQTCRKNLTSSSSEVV